MSELQRHKKSDKVKWAITGITFVLVFVLLAGVFMQLFMPDGKKPADWFKPNKQEEQPLPDQGGETADNGGAVVGEGEKSGLLLSRTAIAPEDYAANGVSAQAETAYTITATVAPSDATDKKVDWSVAFANASSAWATGKTVTDYVTITPQSDGSMTATLECKQAFGEQILVKCSTREVAEIYATATVDYAKKITAFDVKLMKGAEEVEGLYWTIAGEEYKVNVTPVYSTYTIDETFTFNYSIEILDEFVDGVQGKFFNKDGEEMDYVSKGSVSGWAFDSLTFETSYDKLSRTYLHTAGSAQFPSSKMEQLTKNAFKSRVSEYNGAMFTFEVNATGVYGTFTDTVTINSIGANFSVSVTDVTLSDGSFIF